MRQSPFFLTAACIAMAFRVAVAAPLTEEERQTLASFQDLYVFDADFWKKEGERIAATGGLVSKAHQRQLSVELANGSTRQLDFRPCRIRLLSSMA